MRRLQTPASRLSASSSRLKDSRLSNTQLARLANHSWSEKDQGSAPRLIIRNSQDPAQRRKRHRRQQGLAARLLPQAEAEPEAGHWSRVSRWSNRRMEHSRPSISTRE